jgi:thiamine phosphate synthase YjbQ (UPF0047 family)
MILDVHVHPQHDEGTQKQQLEAQNQSINMTSSNLLLGLWQRLLVCRLELDLDVGKNRHVVLSRNVSSVPHIIESNQISPYTPC